MHRRLVNVGLALAFAGGCATPAENEPPVAGAGVLVDSESGAVSVDPASVPLAPGCVSGQTVRRTAAGGWECADDAGLDEAMVDTMVANNGYALAADAQARVTGECPAGAAIRAIDAFGDVTCDRADTLALAGSGTADTAARSDHAHVPSSIDVDGTPTSLQAFADGVLARLTALEQAQCPTGYDYAPEDGYEVCLRPFFGVTDEVVKVGDYWIDRYETSMCPDSGTLGGPTGGDETAGAEAGGGTTTAASCSAAGVLPQTSVSWFQAAQLCANAGKRLCSNVEWQTAVSGTPDPGATAEGGECNIDGDAPVPAGSQSECVSRFGAFDMVGNRWEWVADWSQAPTYQDVQIEANEDATWGSDGTYDVNTARFHDNGEIALGAAMSRGGARDSGDAAGAFAISMASAPSAVSPQRTARCCVTGR